MCYAYSGKAKAGALDGVSAFFVFGLVADIAPQVGHTSTKTPQSEQGDVKEEGIDLLVMPDD